MQRFALFKLCLNEWHNGVLFSWQPLVKLYTKKCIFIEANATTPQYCFYLHEQSRSFCLKEIYILQEDFFHIFITITKLSLGCFAALTLISWKSFYERFLSWNPINEKIMRRWDAFIKSFGNCHNCIMLIILRLLSNRGRKLGSSSFQILLAYCWNLTKQAYACLQAVISIHCSVRASIHPMPTYLWCIFWPFWSCKSLLEIRRYPSKSHLYTENFTIKTNKCEIWKNDD